MSKLLSKEDRLKEIESEFRTGKHDVSKLLERDLGTHDWLEFQTKLSSKPSDFLSFCLTSNHDITCNSDIEGKTYEFLELKTKPFHVRVYNRDVYYPEERIFFHPFRTKKDAINKLQRIYLKFLAGYDITLEEGNLSNEALLKRFKRYIKKG